MSMSEQSSLESLVSILKRAYSGELAAAYAYRGHWHSVSDPDERQEIRAIEDDEWHHRKLIGQILNSFHAKPSIYREVRAALVGRSLAVLCHLGGWLAPMFGAGRLESGNIREYETAARFARAADREDLIECLLVMAEVEWEHEKYFRTKVLSHRWAHHLPIWTEPAPKESIRSGLSPS